MKNDILEKIQSIVGDNLNKNGFKPNKALSLYKYNDKDYRADFVFDVKNRGNSCFQHIKYEFTNKQLDKIFKKFDNKLREKKGNMVLDFSRPALLITDWKKILNKHNIDITGFWFKSYDNVEEVEENREKYLRFTDLAIELKNKLQNTEILKEYLLDNYTEYHLRMYMCIAYINDESLEEAFKVVQEISKDYIEHLKKDLKDFYDLLIE
ncbi:hypothetical protein [Cellulophaga sp. L1A9]|uniref:hypothetical protein n=1 Tax=Cellulophaga sp. L1A9 TaxID=2686362 RepID=UPI00131BDB05|nr:hypothetical protein [Cellulophaga sp. L1A9]